MAHALETHKTVTGQDVEAVIEGREGPLIDGELSAGGRGCSGMAGRVAVAVADGCAAGEAPRSGLAAGATESNVPPHIPQKRMVSGLSLPQRGQRTGSPSL